MYPRYWGRDGWSSSTKLLDYSNLVPLRTLSSSEVSLPSPPFHDSIGVLVSVETSVLQTGFRIEGRCTIRGTVGETKGWGSGTKGPSPVVGNHYRSSPGYGRGKREEGSRLRELPNRGPLKGTVPSEREDGSRWRLSINPSSINLGSDFP